MTVYVIPTTDWQSMRDCVYFSGTFISDAIWKKAGVPAHAKTIEEQADIADWKLG
jgi:hypothetical protein